jgi:hypothetical protein
MPAAEVLHEWRGQTKGEYEEEVDHGKPLA